MFYFPPMGPRAKMEQDDVEFLQEKQDRNGSLSVPFKKSLLQIIREVNLILYLLLIDSNFKKGHVIIAHAMQCSLYWHVLKSLVMRCHM